MWGPAAGLRFVVGSGLCQGSRGAAEDPAGPDPRLCHWDRGVSAGGLGAGLAALSEGTWDPLGGAAGVFCQKEPGVRTRGLGSYPGSGPCLAWVGVTGSRGLREGWTALSQSVLAACVQCEMNERREEARTMFFQGERIGLFKGGVCLCIVCDPSCS